MSLFSGLSRPLKAAGLALIGLAVVAAVIGGVTVLNSGDSTDTAGSTPNSAPPSGAPGGTPAPSSGAPSPGAPTATASATASPPASAPPPSSASGSAPKQSGQPGGQPGTHPGDQQAVAKWVTVRVYNNSTIHGLAARAADDFRASGWNVVEVSNYSAGIIPATTAYYRPGTDEETAAKAMASEFGIRAEARFDGIKQSSPGVIVIVTNNYQGAKGKS